MNKTYSGPPKGTGSVYEWEGKEVGSGRMTVSESAPPEKLTIKLEFIKPFEAVNTTVFELAPQGGNTRVRWIMTGENNMFGKIMEMQQKMNEVQENLASKSVTSEAGGGMVKVTANGAQRITAIKIDPDAVDPDDLELLEDLVIAGVNKALEEAQKSGKNQVIELAPAERKRWESALQPIVDGWRSAHPGGAALLAALQEELKTVRSR